MNFSAAAMAGIRQVLPPASRAHVITAKLMGATLWCWIFWRLKHDWGDVFVSGRGAGVLCC